MDLAHLRTFVAVAEAGSLSKAAEVVHLSQPAVSGHIKLLEQQLGVQLFRRASRGMELTEAGTLLLREARDVLHRADGVTRLAERLRGDVAGTMRLGVIDCGYELRLGRVIAALTQRYPDLEVSLIASTSGENIQAVLDQKLDASLVEGVIRDDRLQAWRLGTSRVGVIGPTAWEADLQARGWAELGELPWVFQSKGCSHCMLLDQISEEQDVRFRPQFRAEVGAMMQLVTEGLALSLADLDEAQPMVDAGRVFVWPHFEFLMPVNFIARRERADEPVIRAFADKAQAFHGGARRKARPLRAAE
jgi:DNA-binding transcriptional LysR family regulator